MDNDIRFMKKANLEGKKALERGDYPAGCAIVKDGKIISKASSCGVTKNDVTAHAEILAVSKACRKFGTRFLEGCTVYANIEPCLMCAKAMVYARIGKVVYGASHREYGDKKTFDILKQNGIGISIGVVEGVEEKTASDLLNKFLESKTEV